MASTVLFTVAVIAVIIALIVVSVFAAMAAARITKSASYVTDTNAQSAHKSLTIAAAMGWVLVVVLIVVMIIGFFAGGFTTSEISDAILQKDRPTATEIAAASKGEKQLSSGKGAQTIVLILLIAASIVTLLVGSFAAHGAVNINKIATKDAAASSAYISSIIAAVVGLGTVGLLVVAVISWIAIREARASKIKELQEFEKKAPPPLPPRPAASTPPPLPPRPAATPEIAVTPT